MKIARSKVLRMPWGPCMPRGPWMQRVPRMPGGMHMPKCVQRSFDAKRSVNTKRPVNAAWPVNAARPVDTARPVDAASPWMPRPVDVVRPVDAAIPINAVETGDPANHLPTSPTPIRQLDGAWPCTWTRSWACPTDSATTIWFGESRVPSMGSKWNRRSDSMCQCVIYKCL